MFSVKPTPATGLIELSNSDYSAGIISWSKTDRLPTNAVTEQTNDFFSDQNGLLSIRPSATVITDLGIEPINEILEVKTRTGVNYIFAAKHRADTSIYRYSDSGLLEIIHRYRDEDKDFSFAVMGNKIYCADKNTPLCYIDMANNWRWTEVTPIETDSGYSISATTTMTGNSYTYWLSATLQTAYGAETSRLTPYATVTGTYDYRNLFANGRTITLTIHHPDAADLRDRGVTGINIYISTKGVSEVTGADPLDTNFFKVIDTANLTGTSTLITLTGKDPLIITDTIPNYNETLLPMAGRVKNINNRLFFWNTKLNPDITDSIYKTLFGKSNVVYSGVNSPLKLYPATDGGGGLQIGELQDEVLQVEIYRTAQDNTNILASTLSPSGLAKTWDILEADLTVDTARVSNVFYAKERTGNLGCISRYGMLGYMNNAYYPTFGGIARLGVNQNLQTVLTETRISDNIRDIYLDTPTNKLNAMRGVGYNGRLYYIFPGISNKNRILVFDIDNKGFWFWNIDCSNIWLSDTLQSERVIKVLSGSKIYTINESVRTSDTADYKVTSARNYLAKDNESYAYCLQSVFRLYDFIGLATITVFYEDDKHNKKQKKQTISTLRAGMHFGWNSGHLRWASHTRFVQTPKIILSKGWSAVRYKGLDSGISAITETNLPGDTAGWCNLGVKSDGEEYTFTPEVELAININSIVRYMQWKLELQIAKGNIKLGRVNHITTRKLPVGIDIRKGKNRVLEI